MSKISKILGVFMLVAIILTACAPATTPPPAATQAPATQPPATEAPTATEAATEAATATAAATEAATQAPAAACPAGKFDFGQVTGGPAGGFLEQAVAGKFKGTTVTVDGTQTDPG